MGLRQLSIKSSASDSPLRMPLRGGRSAIKCFNATDGSSNDWDGLRKDTHLWFDEGDCLVHFYARGGSRRRPSLKVPFASIEKLHSSYLLETCLHISGTESRTSLDNSDSGSSYVSDLSNRAETETAVYNLYIPAPSHLTREQAFSYHIDTRNFFAYLLAQPLVGEKLSTALLGLWQRVQDWELSSEPTSSFREYCGKQGYFDFAGKPGCALAALRFSGETRMRDLWIDSFVHSVGMHKRLTLSKEFESLSNMTVALITRASLEMDLHITRVTKAIGSFLEEELGPDLLGLSKPARDHLDHFRSFLLSFYVNKLGYFPPRDGSRWKKHIWVGMFEDFQNLYNYLADKQSNDDKSNTRGLVGGTCVMQNVEAFNNRHGYVPLPHPVPMLPESSMKRRYTASQKGLRSLKLGRSESSTRSSTRSGQTLSQASNHFDPEIMQSALVQDYQRFERQRLAEKLDHLEARKVRWLLIYGVLQMLTSIVRAPAEVKDTKTPSYPLCVLLTGCPPWLDNDNGAVDELESAEYGSLDGSLKISDLDDHAERVSIRPDCEAENAVEFFSSTGIVRKPSEMSLNMTPAPLRPSAPMLRSVSLRSSMQSSVNDFRRSVVGSISRRNSMRRPSLQIETKTRPSYREIVVEGYGSGKDGDALQEVEELYSSPPVTSEEITSALEQFDFGFVDNNDEPTFQDHHLDTLNKSFPLEFGSLLDNSTSMSRSLSDGQLSLMSAGPYASDKSSIFFSDCDSPATDATSWDGDGSKRNSDLSTSSMRLDAIDEHEPHIARYSATCRSELGSGRVGPKASKSSFVSVNAGCYTPTGMNSLARARSSRHRTLSFESVRSSASASSVYTPQNVQADDIEEEEMRGRRRSRALDDLSSFGFVDSGMFGGMPAELPA